MSQFHAEKHSRFAEICDLSSTVTLGVHTQQTILLRANSATVLLLPMIVEAMANRRRIVTKNTSFVPRGSRMLSRHVDLYDCRGSASRQGRRVHA